MHTFVSIVYVIVCLFLILVVLLQSGKGGGLGSAFGGGASQQIFGGAGAGNLLTRLTAGSAFLFMALSVWLAFLSSSGDQALDRAVRQQAAANEAAAVEEPESADVDATQPGVDFEAEPHSGAAPESSESTREAGEASPQSPAPESR